MQADSGMSRSRASAKGHHREEKGRDGHRKPATGVALRETGGSGVKAAARKQNDKKSGDTIHASHQRILHHGSLHVDA